MVRGVNRLGGAGRKSNVRSRRSDRGLNNLSRTRTSNRDVLQTRRGSSATSVRQNNRRATTRLRRDFNEFETPLFEERRTLRRDRDVLPRENRNRDRDTRESRDSRPLRRREPNSLRREGRNQREESFRGRRQERGFEDNNLGRRENSTRAEDVFEKYLKNRKNPLESFQHLAGDKYKDLFKGPGVNFENPFETANNGKNIFEQVKESSENEDRGNPFAEFKKLNPDFNPFENNQQESTQQAGAKEVNQEDVINKQNFAEEFGSPREYNFFNPFENIKPSSEAEKQSPTDLFAFSRGNATNQNQAQGNEGFNNNEENVANNIHLNQQGEGLQEDENNIGQREGFNASLNDEEMYDEVFEYDTVADANEYKEEDEDFDDNAENEHEHELYENEDNVDLEDEQTSEDENLEEEQAQEEDSEEDDEFKGLEPEPRSLLANVATVLLSVLALLFVSYMLFFKETKSNLVAPELDAVRPVKVFEVKSTQEAGSLMAKRTFPAQVVAFKDLDISFKLAGKVQKVYVSEGDYIKKGQIIAKLDDIDYKYNVEKLEPSLKKLESEYKRAQELFKEQVASKAFLEDAEDKYLTVKRNYEYAKTQLNETVLKAPYSGTVLTKNVENQEYVSPGTSIISVSSSESIEIESFFTESVMAAVVNTKNSNYTVKASFSAKDSKLYDVKVSEFSNVIDPVTQSYRVKYVMKRPKGVNIFSGMISYLYVEPKPDAKVEKTASKIFIPLSAVSEEAGKKYVWVVDSNNVVSKRFITIANASSANVSVESGLKDGDVIVQAGVAYLKNGQKINILADK